MNNSGRLANTTALDQATVTIDLKAIQANTRLAREQSPDSQLLAMVKANAYGHGMPEVAKCIAGQVDYFGVARINEALELTEILANAACEKPVIVLSEILNEDKLRLMKMHGLTPVVYSDHNLEAIVKNLEELELPYWLKIDTGMHRLGLQHSPAALLTNTRFCRVLATHFHSAEEAGSSTAEQINAFQHWSDSYFTEARPTTNYSIANSATLLNHQGADSYNTWKKALFHDDKFAKEIIRPGIMLYGCNPLPNADTQPHTDTLSLQPAMKFSAPIIDIHQLSTGEGVGYNHRWRASRPSTIATVAAGYGDGYPRQAKSGTPVSVNGYRATMVGTVSMDMLSVDISDLVQQKIPVGIGDSVELWGDTVSVNEVANFANTINYELLTGITPRVVRKFKA